MPQPDTSPRPPELPPKGLLLEAREAIERGLCTKCGQPIDPLYQLLGLEICAPCQYASRSKSSGGDSVPPPVPVVNQNLLEIALEAREWLISQGQNDEATRARIARIDRAVTLAKGVQS